MAQDLPLKLSMRDKLRLRHAWVRRTRQDWLGRWIAECREDGCQWRCRCDGPRSAELAMSLHGKSHRKPHERPQPPSDIDLAKTLSGLSPERLRAAGFQEES